MEGRSDRGGLLACVPSMGVTGGESPLGKLVAGTPSEPQGADREGGAERSG